MPGFSLIEYLIVTLLVTAFALPYVAHRWRLPIFGVVGRWARWLLFALLFTYVLSTTAWSTRPDWVHFITGFALWFLLESGYNWIGIKAMSLSELPLFPDFSENRDGDEWPADAKTIELREWLRGHGFKRLSALKAELVAETYLRASVYESGDGLLRLQVLFIPKQRGGNYTCFTLTSHGAEGRRLITDNLFLPFGGFYPENWEMERRPLIGSLPRLVRLHARRLDRSSLEPQPCEADPLEEINEQQRILERLNLETGFLLPRQRQEEEGKISSEGRYRLWKEMWLLAYFGKSVA